MHRWPVEKSWVWMWNPEEVSAPAGLHPPCGIQRRFPQGADRGNKHFRSATASIPISSTPLGRGKRSKAPLKSLFFPDPFPHLRRVSGCPAGQEPGARQLFPNPYRGELSPLAAAWVAASLSNSSDCFLASASVRASLYYSVYVLGGFFQCFLRHLFKGSCLRLCPLLWFFP